MATSTTRTGEAPLAGGQPDPRRWRVLGVLAACQLLVVLSASVVNIALPEAQRALGISDESRSWIVTAYTLTLGGLLLLGGRIADLYGRKRVLVVGLFGFAAASGLGGAAVGELMLLAARGGQGVFAALITPAALSLLQVTFTDRQERATAFSVYGAMAAGGGAVGLLLGGVLTQYASWRWCLLLSAPMALATAAAASRTVVESRSTRRVYLDLPGAASVVLGLGALVYATTRAAMLGWASAQTVTVLAAAVLLLGTFVVIEARSRNPMLPLRLLASRTRLAALVAVLLAGAGLLGMFLFLTLYLQGSLGYTALQAGLAFLPSTAGIVLGTWVTSRLLARVLPRTLLVPGMISAGLGLAWLSRVGLDTSFWWHLAPAEMLVGIGMGIVLVTASSTAMTGVHADDAGIASALVSTSQQVGGALGTALLNTVAATATATFLLNQAGAGELAAVHGYQRAFLVGAVLLGTGALAAGALLSLGRRHEPAAGPG